MSHLLKLDGVSKILPGEIPVTLLAEISFEVTLGEFIIVTGPSGSGKSSLLYVLGLLDQPTNGTLWLRGIDTASFDEMRRTRTRLEHIGFVFQFHFLLPEFTALENVMLPMRRLGELTESQMRERAEILLVQLGLGDQLKKRPKQLSGGQSQRVAIARALSNNPELILADEPTGNLDSKSSAGVREILRELSTSGNHTVITVTHDASFVRETDRLLTVVDGSLVNTP